MKRLIITIIIVFTLVGCGKESEEISNTTPTPKYPRNTAVSFIGVGDNLIHEAIYLEADKNLGTTGDGTYDFKPFYEYVEPDIQKADVAFLNQETVLGGEELTLSGYPSFNSPREVAKDMNDLGFNMFNLANNHSLDKGMIGVEKTIATFDELDDIIYNGIFTNDEDAKKIPVLEQKGIRIALLSYTYRVEGAYSDAYGVSYFDEELIRSEVATAKEISDVILVSAHWGEENTFETNEFQEEYAQLFADLGVDVVLGTHPHTIQPIEWITGVNGNEMLVTYSLANFMGSMLNVDNLLSGMIHFDIVKAHETKDVYIENVKWTPLVIHFEGNPDNVWGERHSHKVYKLKDYTPELAARQLLNGYEGQTVDIDMLWKKTNATIADFYLR